MSISTILEINSLLFVALNAAKRSRTNAMELSRDTGDVRLWKQQRFEWSDWIWSLIDGVKRVEHSQNWTQMNTNPECIFIRGKTKQANATLMLNEVKMLNWLLLLHCTTFRQRAKNIISSLERSAMLSWEYGMRRCYATTSNCTITASYPTGYRCSFQTSKGLPHNIIIQPVIFMALYGSLSCIVRPEVGLRAELSALWHNALTPYSRGLQQGVCNP